MVAQRGRWEDLSGVQHAVAHDADARREQVLTILTILTALVTILAVAAVVHRVDGRVAGDDGPLAVQHAAVSVAYELDGHVADPVTARQAVERHVPGTMTTEVSPVGDQVEVRGRDESAACVTVTRRHATVRPGACR